LEKAASMRLKKYGFNTLVEKKNRRFSYKFLSHFKDPFGILLLFASVLSEGMGVDGGAVGAVPERIGPSVNIRSE
jgi:magnesium-transporting ATPase (P-type)